MSHIPADSCLASDLEHTSWETDEEELAVEHVESLIRSQGSKTAQLLFLGSMFAITGLLLSGFMLWFRTSCDLQDVLAGWVFRRGEYTMCKNDQYRKEVPGGTHPEIRGVVVRIPNARCDSDADCQDFAGSFCSPERNEVREEGICSRVDCWCSQLLYDCGVKQYFKLEFRPADYMYNCTAPTCGVQLPIDVPYWKDNRSHRIGCHQYMKTTVRDLKVWMQSKAAKRGIVSSFKTDEAIWAPLAQHLERIPDLRFVSFWPSTISESVSNGFSPEGRIFFGLMLAAALCLKASDYTCEVQSVDLPGLTIPFVNIEWDTLRAWLPPLGLIILSIVQMVPTSQILDINEGLMTLVHLMGAQFCFVVYLICEAVALHDADNRRQIPRHGRIIRLTLLVIGGSAMATFAVSYIFLYFFAGPDTSPYVHFLKGIGGQKDMYHESFRSQKTLCVRAAEGWWKVLKIVSYVAEFTVALSILLSHLVIWYYFNIELSEAREAKIE